MYVQIYWDQKAEPHNIQVQWNAPGRKFIFRPGVYGGVTSAPIASASFAAAMRYAIERTPHVPHSGSVTMMGSSFQPAQNDGSSAGAAFAVALLAMFNNTSVQNDVCITGTLEPGGHIGKVGGILQKMQAARRAGCNLFLVPRFQTVDNNWDLHHESLRSGVRVYEVDTVDEAYELMIKARH